MRTGQKSTRAPWIVLGVLAMAVAWVCFQLATHGHTGILRTLVKAKHFLINASTSATALPRRGSAPPVPPHRVTLSWNASTTAGAVYNVYRRGTSGIVKLNSVPIAGTSYVDDTVQAGETYYYVAKAVKGTESLPSNEVRVTIPSP